MGLIGATFVGPRIGRFDDGAAKHMPGHDVSSVSLGTLFLFFGWFGFNCGSSYLYLAYGANSAAVSDRVALNMTLSASTSGLTALLVSSLRSGTVDLCVCCNALLAGLVMSTPVCGYVAPWAAVVCGLIAGVWYLAGSKLLVGGGCLRGRGGWGPEGRAAAYCLPGTATMYSPDGQAFFCPCAVQCARPGAVPSLLPRPPPAPHPHPPPFSARLWFPCPCGPCPLPGRPAALPSPAPPPAPAPPPHRPEQLRLQIDDPLDSSAVHFGCGVLGTLLLGFLARPGYVRDLTGYAECGGIVYGADYAGGLLLGLQLTGGWEDWWVGRKGGVEGRGGA